MFWYEVILEYLSYHLDLILQALLGFNPILTRQRDAMKSENRL